MTLLKKHINKKIKFSIIFIVIFILFSSEVVFAQKIDNYNPDNSDEKKYWRIVRLDELIKVENDGKTKIFVKMMFEFFNITADKWEIFFELDPNIISYEIYNNKHIKYIIDSSITKKDDYNILSIMFDPNISKDYRVYTLGFNYTVEKETYVKTVSEFYETFNRYKLKIPIGFISSFKPENINYFIVLPGRASIQRNNFEIKENVEIDENQFDLIYYDYDFLYPDTDDKLIDNPKLIENPTIEEYLILEIESKESFDDNKIFIEYTTPNDAIGILVLIAAIFSILSFFFGVYVALVKRKKNKEVDENMKTNWIKLRTIFLLVGLVTIIIATIFMLTGVFFNRINLIESAKWLASIGISLVSIGIAIHSIIISNKSDEKMMALSDVKFIELADNFVDYARKCSFIMGDNIQTYHERNDFYKWRTDLKKARKLKKWANNDRQVALSHAFVNILQNLPWDKKLITNKNIIHLLRSCGRIIEFKIYKKDNESMISILKTNVDERFDSINFIGLINQITSDLNSSNKLDEPFVKEKKEEKKPVTTEKKESPKANKSESKKSITKKPTKKTTKVKTSIKKKPTTKKKTTK